MLSRDEFAVLNALRTQALGSQREIAHSVGISLGKANTILRGLCDAGWLSRQYTVTDAGYDQLAPYKVDNAVIMAAGMSSRFAPLSYENPKGLLLVKGEILIERQIRQLQEAGIRDITVVVGYMKEKFFYLHEKFQVDIVVNEEYYRYNNPSTLLLVQNKLKNTYICSSDNYYSENVFRPYMYDACYAAVYQAGASSEYGLHTGRSGRIRGVDMHSQDMWIMLGYAYFSQPFSACFRRILNAEYEQGATKYELWENLLARHLEELEIYIRPYPDGVIHEFDSLQELRDFDDRYLKNCGSRIFDNICSALGCSEDEITGIDPIKQGLTNLSFKFTCRGADYVYRHPGAGTEKYISRPSEAFSLTIAKQLRLDPTTVYIDPRQGWKISHYIRDAHCLNYHDPQEVRQALAMVRRLHEAAIRSDYDFNIWERTENLVERTAASHKDYADFDLLHAQIEELYRCTQRDQVPWVLCHCDCYDPNFLVADDGRMFLIDWEYSGNDDPANDLGTFICCSDYTYEEALSVLRLYYGRELTPQELRHALAYVAIASYYWYVWAIYQESIGNTVGQYLFLWYTGAKEYYKRSIAMYKEEE